MERSDVGVWHRTQRWVVGSPSTSRAPRQRQNCLRWVSSLNAPSSKYLCLCRVKFTVKIRDTQWWWMITGRCTVVFMSHDEWKIRINESLRNLRETPKTLNLHWNFFRVSPFICWNYATFKNYMTKLKFTHTAPVQLISCPPQRNSLGLFVKPDIENINDMAAFM